MLKPAISVDGSRKRRVGLAGRGRSPITTASSTTAGFLIALALAAVVLAIFGVGDRGTAIALRATARWSFLLFWLAYAGSAMAKLFGWPLNRLAAHGRDFGLAFASAQLIHVGLVLWLIYLSARPGGTMLVFWAGIACTYLLALLSWQRLRDALGPRLWWVVCTAAMEYIAYVFAVDFILIPLQAHGETSYPPSYLPFAVMLVAGFGLRITALVRDQIAAQRPQRKAVE